MRAKIVVIAIAALSIFLLREPIFNYLNSLEEGLRLRQFVSELPKVKQSDLDVLVKKIEKEIQAPPPLRAKTEASQAFLTRAGVIQWTNTQRQSNGVLPALAENAKLDAAATAKLKDMFSGQYFEHVSPSGVGPAQVAKNAGYEFIAEGENLALGNFQDDKVLVQAWMDSPGHRANILGSRFTEIGIAVGRGIYEGRQTWLAVQEFGLPLSACSLPDESIKMTVSAYKGKLNDLARLIEVKRDEIENTRPKKGTEYNGKIEEYNALVNEYNNLVDQYKDLAAQYNNQIQAFNTCLDGFSASQ